jgi:hypothetical protein
LEVKSAIDECRGLEKARRAFMKITKSVSWEEAKLKYPRHTNDMALKEFSKITSLDKNIPPAFVAFCQSAVDGQKKPDATEIQLMAVNYCNVTGLKIRQEIPEFPGCQFILAVLEKVRS